MSAHGVDAPEVTDALDAPDAGAQAARGSVVRTVGFGIATVLGVISAPILIRGLGVEGFGQYVTVLSLITIVSGFSEAGMAAILQREYVARDTERAAVMSDLLGIRLTLTTVGGFAGVGVAALLGYPPVLVWATAIAALALLLQSTQTFLSGALQAELRFGWVTAAEVLRQVVFVGLVALLALLGTTLLPVFVAQTVAFALTLAMVVALVRGLVPLRPSFRPRRWCPLLRDTFAYAVAVALSATYFRVAVIALSVSASPVETGRFATSFRVVELLVGVPGLVVGAAFPILARAAREDDERLGRASSRLVEISAVLGVALGLGIGLAAAPIIRLIAGAGADPSVLLLRLLAAALVPTFVITACGFILLSLRKHRTILLVNLLALVGSLVSAAVLVPTYGSRGAAVAVLGVEVLLAVAFLFALAHHRPDTRVTIARLPVPLLMGAVGACVLLVPGVPGTADAALGLAIYGGLLWATGRVPPEAGELVRTLRGATADRRSRH